MTTSLIEPLIVRLEPIDTAQAQKCECEAYGCPHEIGPVLLLDTRGRWLIGRWTGEGWFCKDGLPVAPIAWARLPSFTAQLHEARAGA